MVSEKDLDRFLRRQASVITVMDVISTHDGWTSEEFLVVICGVSLSYV